MAKLIEITGKAISGEWGNDDENGSGIPVLRTTNFTNAGIINYSKVVTRIINKKNIAEKFLRKGDIIIEKSGGSDKQPVGRVVYFDAEENKYLFNNFTSLLRIIDSNICFSKYLFYILFFYYHNGNTIPFENKTTGLHNLKIDEYVKNCEIPLPPIEVQRQIAENLDKVTRTIDLCNAILEKLDLLVKARFVEMFGGIHDSNLYSYQSVDTFTHVLSGGTPDRKNNDYWKNGKIPWIKTTELHNNVIREAEENITENGLDKSSAKLVPKGTILIAMYGQGKTRGMTALLDIESSTNQACACILPCDKLNQIYLWQYFILSYDKLRDLAKGGNQPNLNVNIIKKFPVLIPPLTMQQQFSAFVEQTDKSKSAVKQVLEKAETLKKALMQEYFG